MESSLVTLTSGDFVAAVAPALGASITRLTWRGKDLLRPSDRAAIASGNPRLLSCFPMAPWAGPIAQGGFHWDGRTVQLPPDCEQAPHAVHGQVWRRPWNLDRLAADHLVLSCLAGGDEWPWRYRAEFELRLGKRLVIAKLAVTNTDSAPMPAWIGLHPYFPAKPAKLRFQAERVWRMKDHLPVQETCVPAEWRCDDFCPPPDLNHCFTRWNAGADLRLRRVTLRVGAEGAPYLGVHASQEAERLCLTPQTGAPDAIHLGGAGGLRTLKPSESLAMSMTLAPSN